MAKEKLPAVLYKADGTKSEVTPKSGKRDFSLEEMQGFVSGHIELVYVGGKGVRGTMLVINDEGKIKGLPFNAQATQLLNGTGYEGDFISGDALFIYPDQIK